MRIAMVAPPWLPVPPPAYGGIETVVAHLVSGLVDRGHDLTMFAAPGSSSGAQVRTVLPTSHPDEIERALYEVDHVSQVFDCIDAAARLGRPYDVLHDHCGFTTFAMANRIDLPVVHTLHGPFTEETSDFYRRNSARAPVVAISETQARQAPAELCVVDVIPNPIDAREWPFTAEAGEYVLWIGRVCEVKGPHRAIEAARAARMPLVLAGPVQPGEEEFFARCVEPHVDGTSVRYVGTVGGAEKRRLFRDARALLMPISWPEPFGMVMTEALVCGTPVIAFRRGAATEIVRDGLNGLLVQDVADMAEAIGRVTDIDRGACRKDVEHRFGVARVAGAYERVYRRVVASAVTGAPVPGRTEGRPTGEQTVGSN